MSPRELADLQIKAMREAAQDVWRLHQGQVKPEDRDEWRKLCRTHIANWFAREWHHG